MGGKQLLSEMEEVVPWQALIHSFVTTAAHMPGLRGT
jgi:hypothetical protein